MSEGLLETGRGGARLMRDSVVLALFSRRPADELAPGVRALLEHWTSNTPPEARSLSIVGVNATSVKAHTKRSQNRCDKMLATPGKDVFFAIQGPQTACPDHGFSVALDAECEPGLPWTSVVQIVLPPESMDDPEALVHLARTAATLGPFDSGVMSHSIALGAASDHMKACPVVGAALERIPALDFVRADTQRVEIGTRPSGVGWLTLLSDAHVTELGGAASLKAELEPAMAVERVGAGWMLRAGPSPRTTHEGRLQWVGRALRPLFDSDRDDGRDSVFDDDEDALRVWRERFMVGEVPPLASLAEWRSPSVAGAVEQREAPKNAPVMGREQWQADVRELLSRYEDGDLDDARVGLAEAADLLQAALAGQTVLRGRLETTMAELEEVVRRVGG